MEIEITAKTEFRAMTAQDHETMMAHCLYEQQKENPQAPYFETFAYEHHGELFGCGGFQMITETTAWCWVALTDLISSRYVPAYRVIKEFLEKWCLENGIVRLQAWVKQDFIEGERLVEHLNFQKEGDHMKDFCGKGVSAQLYVKFFDVKETE